jgi:hypothetical protein
LFQDQDIPVPKWASLKGADSTEALETLTVPDTNPTKLRCKCVLMVPPLGSTTILTSPSMDPFELIPLLSATFQDFDRTSETVKACTLLRPVLEFLWAAKKKLITPIIFSQDNSPEGRKWSLHLHLSCITQDVTTNITTLPESVNQQGAILDTIVDSLQRISNSPDRSKLNELSNDDSKKDSHNSWDKIPDVIQQMILKLSAVNDSVFAPGPCETYLQILKQNKSLGAAMIINVLLSTMGCQVEITTSMANAIKTGNFRANSLQVAHPFSIFNVPYVDAANMTCFNQTELELLQSEGEGIPKDIVKKLSENKFKSPTSSHLLRHQFNNWYGVLQLCFGPKALITLEAREWINHIDKYETSYDSNFKGEKDFGAKVLGLVDLTFFQLCDSCIRASSPDDVDYSLVS